MRKLAWFTLGFAGSCAIGAYLLRGNLLGILAAAALVLSLAAWVICKCLRRKAVPTVILLGCCVGFLWFWGYDGGYLSPASELDGVTTQATIEITDYGFQTDYGNAADGLAHWQGRSYRIRVYLNDFVDLTPGTLVSGSFRFRITDEGLDQATYHRGEGIALMAYQSGEGTIQYPETPWWYYPAAHIRHTLLEIIKTVFPADTEAFVRALLLGDDSDLSYEINTAFQVTGIRHIIAVSGLHVSILFGFLYTVSGKRRWLTALVGIPVLVLFAAVAGFTPSVTRACLMHGLMMVSMLFRREYDSLTSLAFAALTMLVLNPMVITAVGFQLSVGCMLGIFLFAMPIKNWLLEDGHLGHAKGMTWTDKLVRGVAGSISVSLGAISLTTPLAALYFGTVSLISPLTNLLTLWMVTWVFYAIMLVCGLGLVWLEAGKALAGLVSWGIRYILGVSGLLARIPMAAVYTVSPWILIWLLGTYLLLGIFLLSRNKKPALYSCLTVLGLCAALLTSWIEPTLDSCRMTVLDVGQGQSIILQSGGKTFVVDCGGTYADDAADLTAETLLSMGIQRIDGLILTHYDADHSGGAGYLLTRIQTDDLYLPGWEPENFSIEDLSPYQVHYLDQDLLLTWDGGSMTLFASEFQDDRNESSLCVLFQAADCDILITGDRRTLGEKLLMQRCDLPELDVLVVGHHGSNSSTSPELLAKTSPALAVISVDENNRYGHPGQQTLDRLAEAGCTVLRTDEDGTIIIRR